MIKVVLIGTGNVAKFLFDEFSTHPQLSIEQVVGRNIAALDYFKERANVSSNYKELKRADIYILAVKDTAIEKVSKDAGIQEGLMVHTSGSIAMEALPENVRRGVFYPLQTFSGVAPGNRKNIPICLEAEKEVDYSLLEQLANYISTAVYRISSEKRRQLHLAAVFANNFSNHMYFMAAEICEEHGLPFELLKPLILETSEKILQQSPYTAQTGPARRNDLKTIEEHLSLLSRPEQQKAYSTLTESIQQAYGKKL
jgi:predicted short-subunit dehydrogenase-like oxidoreductase (DUF2520 family)